MAAMKNIYIMVEYSNFHYWTKIQDLIRFESIFWNYFEIELPQFVDPSKNNSR